MLVLAVGLGACCTASAVGGTAGVADVDQGVAGGLLNTAKQVGAAVGVAALMAVATTGDGNVDGPLDQALLVKARVEDSSSGWTSLPSQRSRRQPSSGGEQADLRLTRRTRRTWPWSGPRDVGAPLPHPQ